EAPDVRVVERSVDLVDQAERARPVLEDREHQRHRGQRLLAAGEELYALQALAPRLRDGGDDALARGDDVAASRERGALVEQHQAGLAAAEERREGLLEVLVDDGERLLEAL